MGYISELNRYSQNIGRRRVKIDPYVEVNPPLRVEEERIRLGQHLKPGVIDASGSDHAPRSYVAIEKDRSDMMAVPGDSPGLEMMLPFLLT